eukprot:4665210-Alexandrium_andersonii.AAC.1
MAPLSAIDQGVTAPPTDDCSAALPRTPRLRRRACSVDAALAVMELLRLALARACRASFLVL